MSDNDWGREEQGVRSRKRKSKISGKVREYTSTSETSSSEISDVESIGKPSYMTETRIKKQKNILLLKFPYSKKSDFPYFQQIYQAPKIQKEKGTSTEREISKDLSKGESSQAVVKVPVPPGRRGDSMLTPKTTESLVSSASNESDEDNAKKEEQFTKYPDHNEGKGDLDFPGDHSTSIREMLGPKEISDEENKAKLNPVLPFVKIPLDYFAFTGGFYTWAIARSLPNYKRYVKVSVRELLIFTIFLIILAWVGMGALLLYRNIYCKVIMNVLTKTLYKTNASITAVTTTTSTYYSIKKVHDVWNYLNHHFLNVMYFYNIEERLSLEMPKEDPLMVLFENIIVGPPRIRQVRVSNDSCKIPKLFTPWYNTCYSYFSDTNEDRQTFGNVKGSEWTWRLTSDTAGYMGKLSTYSPHGYYVDLFRTYNSSQKIVTNLQQNKWIDRGTRAVFVDFVAYTPNTNLFAVVKLVMEVTPNGGVIPSANCYAMELIRFFDVMGIVAIVLQALLFLFIIYFLCILICDCRYFGCSYLFTFWGLLDFSILLSFICLVALAVYREMIIMNKLPKLVRNIDEDKHGSFDSLVAIQKLFITVFGILIIFCWIKMIKFFSMCTTIAILFITIGKTNLRLLGITIIAVFLLTGFSMAAHLFFGNYVEDFSTIGSSMYSLLTIPVGGLFFFEEAERQSPILAPIFLAVFIFIFILLIFSLFIAVLVYGFERAEEKCIISGPKRKYGFYEYLLHICISIANKFRLKKSALKLKQKEVEIEVKKDHEMILNILARHGLRGEELRLFMEKHGINEETPTTDEQLITMYRDLKTKQLLEVEVKTHDNLLEHTEDLQKKLTIMEGNIKEMYTQVNNLLERLQISEPRRSM